MGRLRQENDEFFQRCGHLVFSTAEKLPTIKMRMSSGRISPHCTGDDQNTKDVDKDGYAMQSIVHVAGRRKNHARNRNTTNPKRTLQAHLTCTKMTRCVLHLSHLRVQLQRSASLLRHHFCSMEDHRRRQATVKLWAWSSVLLLVRMQIPSCTGSRGGEEFDRSKSDAQCWINRVVDDNVTCGPRRVRD